MGEGCYGFNMSTLFPKGKRPKRRDIQCHDNYHEVASPNLPLDQYNVVSDNKIADHLINFIDRQPDYLKVRGGWRSLKDMYKAATTNRDAKKIIDKCGWGRLFKIDVGNSNVKLVEGLIERWWDTTHTFQLPHLEIGFTPLDFTFLTGIPIGNGDPPPFDAELFSDYDLTMATYFPNMIEHVKERNQCYKVGGIIISDLKSYVINSRSRQTKGEGEEIARAFLMWVVGQVFFGNSSSVVNIGWLAAFDDLSHVHSYDWGSAILARLYKSLDECCRCVTAFGGMWMLLEYWFYTYFHTCTPNLDSSCESMDQWPVTCAYNKSQLSKQQIDTGRHSLRVIREHVELRTPETTIWTPYSESQYAEEDHIILAHQLSTHRVILFDPESNEGLWYLGDRCWRQIHGSIVVPANPPPRESLSNIPEWKFELERAAGWVPAETYIVWANEVKFNQYWRHVSRATALPAVHIDPTQGVPIDPSIYYCNWTMQVAGSSGESITIPITSRAKTTVFPPDMYTKGQWATFASEMCDLNHELRMLTLTHSASQERIIREREQTLRERDQEIQRLRMALAKSV